MSLVDYSDDEDDFVVPEETRRKFQHGPRLLNSAFHDQARHVEHAAGFWPCHVYLEFFPTAPQRAEFAAIASQINFEPLATTDLGAVRPLHVSLSETLMIASHHREALLQSLEAWVRSLQLGPQPVSPEVSFLPNPTGEKLFAAVAVGGQVPALISSLNRLLAGLHWDLALLDARPHLSIAVAPASATPVVMTQHTLQTAQFSVVCVRMGHETHTLRLA